MRVLWFSLTPSCYEVVSNAGWIEALEKVVVSHLPDVELGICFEYPENRPKEKRGRVAYYPLCLSSRYRRKHKLLDSPQERYNDLESGYLSVIEDFKPDVVHCFGTERWHYGLLSGKVNIPFVIHMMGFMNIYDMMDELVIHKSDYWKYYGYNPLKVWLTRRTWKSRKENQELERSEMSVNHYFMGRTEWDRSIVKYYSPEGKYFHCPEAIREEIYNARLRWSFKRDDCIKLVTIGNAGSLKGNEIMLRAAHLLKYQFKRDFKWVYTSDEERMAISEKMAGIRHEDVNIQLVGRINAKQIAEQLCQAEFYVHPSIIDNSPNTVCEAQLMGIPVISTNAGGIPQLVEDGKTGFLYPYAEPHALAFKIMELHNDEKLLKDVSQNEWDMSHKRHDPQYLAERLHRIYKEVIAVYYHER